MPMSKGGPSSRGDEGGSGGHGAAERGSDEKKRALLRRFREALPVGGLMAGFFPAIFTPVEFGYLQPDRRMLDHVNLEERLFAEEQQGITQIFYSPLRLRALLREAGFRLQRMEVALFDSPDPAEHARTYYRLGDDPDVMAWGLFVEAVAEQQRAVGGPRGRR